MTFNPVDFKEDCADDINNDEEPDNEAVKH